jgi:lysyl-tRNA synthetase class 2
MPLDDQIAQRRANFQAIGDLGVSLYPNAFDATASASELVERHGASSGEALDAERPEVRVAGRILGIRAFGKASFLVLSDGRSTIQAYLRQDALSERDWAIYKHLDFGDQVGVAGRVFRSKTNELSVWASSLSFLAKCFLPLPEKWHGLQDVETRYRQRYLDLAVNPESRRVFEVRSRTVSAIRRFFEARAFLEVETPMMQPIAGGALARPFVTHHNALDMKLYLRIAPELYLKRLTVGGMARVFEINRNFRNEGVSTQHNPEFTMLEFYQAYAEYQGLMALTETLVEEVARSVVGTTDVQFNGQAIALAGPWRRLSLRDAAAERASEKLGTTVTADMLRDRATAADVMPELPGEPNYSTVRTQLRVLEEKGHVRHEEEGGRYVYAPAVPRHAARKSALKHLVETFFDGSAEQVVAAVLGGEASRLSDEDLERISGLIDKARKDGSRWNPIDD